MRFTQASLGLACATLATALPSQSGEPSCRFAQQYTQQQILKDPSNFINDMLYWEGKFHQNNVSFNSNNGMSYDGTNIDWVTGERTVKHPFSAASKEVSSIPPIKSNFDQKAYSVSTKKSLQVMLYAHAISGSAEAARFLSPRDPSAAPGIAASIMELKLQAYLGFNETYPGFGGFLPWFTSSSQDLSPTWDWNNRVPGLDNG